MEINRYIDHSVLFPNMTKQMAQDAIRLGIDYETKTVCVRPCDIDMAVNMCAGTKTGVSCVLDFPHGTGGAVAKGELAALYVSQGVNEIDMVMDYSAALSGNWDIVAEGINNVVNVAHEKGVLVKVIFETSELSLEQIRKASIISVAAGADFIKTSTGFAGGVTVDAVKCMLETAGDKVKVKVSGGVVDFKSAKLFVDMGAMRLGVKYSNTPVIVDGISNADATSNAKGIGSSY